MSKRVVYVLVPVKVTVFDEEVSGIEMPNNADVEHSIKNVGYWDNADDAKYAIYNVDILFRAQTDRILKYK